MDNLKSPAAPVVIANEANRKDNGHQMGTYEFQKYGFTKLELASLVIAQGMLANSPDWSEKDTSINWVSINSVKYAKAVLEEANK
jgi:hypothetical protein